MTRGDHTVRQLEKYCTVDLAMNSMNILYKSVCGFSTDSLKLSGTTNINSTLV